MDIFKYKNDCARSTFINTKGVPVIKFCKLDKLKGITHGFSTRLGGVSEGIYESMNLSFTRGDKPELVMENFRRFAEALNIRCDQMVFSDQTHTTNLKIVSKSDCGKGILYPKDYKDIDGLITDREGVALVTFFADCVPLFFADPIRRVIGLSHSGWRGTAGRIGEKTVARMTEAFGCRPSDIRAAIGPSICGRCYEIGEDVASVFRARFSKEAYQEMMTEKDSGKFQLDLWKANARILLEAGISQAHLEITDICTCCNSSVMWSHRSAGGRRGSLAAFLMLN